MIKRFFNKLVGRTSEPVKKETSVGFSEDDSSVNLDNAAGFVKYVVKSLVDNPDDVKIEIKEESKGSVINIHCRKEDIGKIIGKSGKTIMAIRTLVSGTASRINRHINVEVVDQLAD